MKKLDQRDNFSPNYRCFVTAGRRYLSLSSLVDMCPCHHSIRENMTTDMTSSVHPKTNLYFSNPLYIYYPAWFGNDWSNISGDSRGPTSQTPAMIGLN